MKRNLRKAFAFILALTMVVSLFACGKKDANPDGGDSSSDDTFTIAYIGPLTGEASAWGTPEANTLKLLVDQVNAEGGIAGKKVILNTYAVFSRLPDGNTGSYACWWADRKSDTETEGRLFCHCHVGNWRMHQIAD